MSKNQFDDLMKKAKSLNKQMETVQKSLEGTEKTGHASGGLVKFTLNGKLDGQDVNIDKSILKDQIPEKILEKLDLTELEDAILASYQDVKVQIEKVAQEEMRSATSGLNIPGLT